MNLAPILPELLLLAGTTWLATLTKGAGRDRVDRWLLIDDADGRVVASGTQRT